MSYPLNKTITFVISSLSPGGAERVVALLANHLCSKYRVHLILIGDAQNNFYFIDARAKIHQLKMLKESSSVFKGIINNLKRIRSLSRIIRHINPDIVISFIFSTNILTLLSSLFIKTKVIVSERNDPRKYSEGHLAWNILRRLTYPFAHALVVLNKDMYHLLRHTNFNTKVIKNPVVLPINKGIGQIKHPNVIMGLGSLSYQKGFDILIEAFRLSNLQEKNWKLYIFGEGEKRKVLEELVCKNGLKESVFLPGLTTSPSAEFERSKIFVFSSRFEGLGHALIEAMSNGMAVISTDCPSGPSEIIKNYENGVLVPVEDAPALAKVLVELSQDPKLRKSLSSRAKAIKEHLSIERISKEWEALF